MIGGSLIQAQVHPPQRQGFRHPQAGPEHDPEGHASLVAGRGVDQGDGFLFGEVVGELPEPACHPTAVLSPFGKRYRKYSPRTGGMQGGLGRDLPGGLSKIADKRKRRSSLDSPLDMEFRNR